LAFKRCVWSKCRMPAGHPIAAVALPRGLYGADQVDVAYEPWRALGPTVLRLGPYPDAPPVLADDGTVVALERGQLFGRQSTRNPGCLDRPPLRAAVMGFAWGYCIPPATRKSGWMRLADLEFDPLAERRACGPAGADFDRRDPTFCGGHCDGRPVGAFAATSGEATIVARDVYLRYAPGSTAFRYLVRGDRVRRLVKGRGDHIGWTGVEVRQARWTATGARGWLLESALFG
jgi:hypothetical protein